MTKKQPLEKNIPFEKALEQLEKISDDMESEGLSLDASLKKYQEGIELIRYCTKKLDAAEKKIDIVMKDTNGNLKKVKYEELNEGSRKDDTE